MDGVVLAKNVELGEVVTVNQTLFKVGDLTNLILEVSRRRGRHRPRPRRDGRATPRRAAAVSLYAFPKEIFGGAVFEMLPDANRERKSFLAKVRLDKPPPGLRSGMSAEVNIIARRRRACSSRPSEAEANGERVGGRRTGAPTSRRSTIGVARSRCASRS